MQITLNQYILNPMGKSNAVLNATAREAIRSSYMKKFDSIMLREHGNISYTLYKDEKRNRFYAYIKIPSEVVPKFYYDTIIEFYTDANVKGAGKNLLDYNVRFFSNDPAFVYTYAHVFNQNDLFISELRSKMSKKAIRDSAQEKNPNVNVGYVKSIYFAYLFIKNKGLNNVDKFNGEANKIDFKYLLSQIEDADSKILKRQEEGTKVSKQKSASKERKINNSENISTSNKIRSTKSTNSIKSVNSSRSVKTVKRK